MDGWKCRGRGGCCSVSLSLSLSLFHVLIYSVWLIPFTPAAGAIPVDVWFVPPPSSPCFPLFLLYLSSPLPLLAHLLGRSPLHTPCSSEETDQACRNHGNGGNHNTPLTPTPSFDRRPRKKSLVLIWRSGAPLIFVWAEDKQCKDQHGCRF